MLLECSALSKSYGRVEALKGVDFRLSSGLSFIIGPNGSGKTTLIKILARLIEPDSGRITINGTDYRKVDGRRMGFSFEKTVFPSRIKIREYLSAVAEFRGEDNSDELIELFDLKEYADRRFGSLSQGYKRRFLVALAFAGWPDVVFLDEPFSNVDIIAKKEMIERFYDLKRKVSIVVVSHVFSGLEDLDSLLVLYGGRVVANLIGRELEELQGFRAIFDDGTVIENDLNELMGRIRSGGRVVSIQPYTLEEIILRLLGA